MVEAVGVEVSSSSKLLKLTLVAIPMLHDRAVESLKGDSRVT